MPRPPPPAAALSMTGKPTSRANRSASCVGADAAVGARHGRNAEFDGGALGGDLVAHQADMLGPRTDKLHIVIGENFGETGVLREKSIARMHGVGAGDLAGRKQGRDVEVAVLGGGRADADALVGEPHMHGVRVRGRMHRHRRNAEFFARPQHAQRDFPPVGDQDFIEHLGLGRIANWQQRTDLTASYLLLLHSMIISGSPYSTGWPSSTRIWMTVPERGAGI